MILLALLRANLFVLLHPFNGYRVVESFNSKGERTWIAVVSKPLDPEMSKIGLDGFKIIKEFYQRPL